MFDPLSSLGFKKAKMKMDFAASSNFLTELEIVAKCEAFFEDSSAFKIVEKWVSKNGVVVESGKFHLYSLRYFIKRVKMQLFHNIS